MLALPRIILYGGVAVAIYLRLPKLIRKIILQLAVLALGGTWKHYSMSFI